MRHILCKFLHIHHDLQCVNDEALSTCCVVQRWDFDVGITFQWVFNFHKNNFFSSLFLSFFTLNWWLMYCRKKNIKLMLKFVGTKSVFSHKQWKCMSTFLPLHIEKNLLIGLENLFRIKMLFFFAHIALKTVNLSVGYACDERHS